MYVEKSFLPATIRSLERIGYKINMRESIGRTELIMISYKPKKQITAVADSRGDDSAAGY